MTELKSRDRGWSRPGMAGYQTVEVAGRKPMGNLTIKGTFTSGPRSRQRSDLRNYGLVSDYYTVQGNPYGQLGRPAFECFGEDMPLVSNRYTIPAE